MPLLYSAMMTKCLATYYDVRLVYQSTPAAASVLA